jgi:hypothetical protein
LHRIPHRFRNGLPFLEDFVVPIPKDSEALRSQPVIASFVVSALGFRVVMAAVQLNDQALFQANEIDDVVARRELPAELEVLESAAAKLSPQKRLRFRGKASKFPRAIRMASQNQPPHPWPLSREGRGEGRFIAASNILARLSRDRLAWTGQPPVQLIML